MKINQPRRYGRDGQAACENVIKQVKDKFNHKTNETIPEYTQMRIDWSAKQRKRLFLNSYNNKTVPQRIRKSENETDSKMNDENDIENEIDQLKDSKWYRGKNVKQSDFVSNFKTVTDRCCNRFGCGKLPQK